LKIDAPDRPDLIGPDAFADNESVMEFVIGVLEASTEYSIVATDSLGVIQLWNEGARRLYGYASPEIIGRSKGVLHTEADALRGLPQEMMRRAAEDGKWEGTVERVRKDGTTFTARVILTPRPGRDGVPVGFLMISRDVTDELRLGTELGRSRYTLSVLESAADAMVIVDAAGEIRLANAATEKLFGYPREELIGRPVEILLPDRYRDRHPGHRVGFFDSPLARPMGAGMELWGRRKDGLEVPIEISLSQLETDEGLHVTAAIRDVTERKRFEEDLGKANLKLEAGSRAKDSFLASMSHELRTPLNAILGFTGTLLMGLPGPLNAEQTKQLRTVQTGGRQLLSLINDLLDVARIEAGKVDLKVEPIGCQELLEEVAGGLRTLADAKGLELVVHAPDDRLEIHSDRRALSQILINFANNGIKFTDEGSISLEVSRHRNGAGSGVRFTVVDTGSGIKAGDQEHLFAAFEQLEASNDQPYGGTGLGLYISQTLATLIGGAITFTSEFGKGSAFTLELPE
jgi:protein-histidine pros-kinase